MKCYVHPDVDAVGTCTVCGRSVCQNCAIDMNGKLTCKSCVEKMASQPSGKAIVKKEPVLALLLSLVGGLVIGLLIGLGQIYNGQVRKGIILCAINLVLEGIIVTVYVLISIFTLGLGFLCCLPIFAAPLLTWLYAMYDAYIMADRINKGEPVKDWLE